MENHRRIWQRFVSRLRGSRGTHSYFPRSVLESRNVTSSTIALDTSFPGRYSRFVRNNVRTRPRLQISQSDWNFANSFARLGRLDKLVSFTPKCLTGFNAQPLLSGQISYDDFSENCWLENHLHRFGGLNTDVVSSEDSNNIIDNEIDAQVSSENESVASSSHNETSVPTAVNVRSNRSATGSITNSSSLSSHSTVSDITHFYLAGFAFDPDSTFLEPPPPYCELHDDPPPPYTESPESTSSESQNNVNRSTSNQGIQSHDILW